MRSDRADCLDVLLDVPEGAVRLVYLDPPFFTQKSQGFAQGRADHAVGVHGPVADADGHRARQRSFLSAFVGVGDDDGALFLQA